MSQSSSDTDAELLLFTRDHQRGILDVVKDEVGVDLSQEMENFSESLVTSFDQASDALQVGQAGSTSAVAAGSQGPSSGPVIPPAPLRLPPSTPGSVPAVSRWPGQHAFCVTVSGWGVAPAARQPAYVYSTATGKLYTDLMVSVPFRFSYKTVPAPERLQIRALPVYCDAQHVQTPVRRCAVHREKMHPSNVDVQHVRHVVRAQHPDARHEELGERCSAVVPLEPLEPATDDYAVLFKFTCMNTCMGGMNRRRLLVVFTLEEKGSGGVLGRHALEVKVCKCPHRDSRADEKRRSGDRPQLKRPRPASPAPAPPPQTPAGGQLVVTADDEAMFQALLELRNSLRRYRRSLTSPQPTSDGERLERQQ